MVRSLSLCLDQAEQLSKKWKLHAGTEQYSLQNLFCKERKEAIELFCLLFWTNFSSWYKCSMLCIIYNLFMGSNFLCHGINTFFLHRTQMLHGYITQTSTFDFVNWWQICDWYKCGTKKLEFLQIFARLDISKTILDFVNISLFFQEKPKSSGFLFEITNRLFFDSLYLHYWTQKTKNFKWRNFNGEILFCSKKESKVI